MISLLFVLSIKKLIFLNYFILTIYFLLRKLYIIYIERGAIYGIYK
nr:MAG TPA: hypothetical protein [Caudoviricetes sp.]